MSRLGRFERIVRATNAPAVPQPVAPTEEPSQVHPFDERNIHPEIAKVALKLFDDGHYPQATFEAFKYIDKAVSDISGIQETGEKLMMQAFTEGGPRIKLTDLNTMSEISEQKGFKFMFAGSMGAIRNPRGHEYSMSDPVSLCLDHLSFASTLLRRLDGRIDPPP